MKQIADQQPARRLPVPLPGAQPLAGWSRRRFLSVTGGALGAGVLLGRVGVPARAAAAGRLSLSPALPATGADSRVLVLVQLNGGNDGLNTVVPIHPGYVAARPTLHVPERELLDAGWPGYGLHPALAPMRSLVASGRVAAIHGIGFAQPNRSHFVSMERWWRGGRSDVTTGWLGRAADRASELTGALSSVALGSGAPVMTGDRHQPTVVVSAERFMVPGRLADGPLASLAAPSAGDGELAAALRASYARAQDAVAQFATITAPDAGGDDEAPPTDAPGALTRGLRLAGQLVARSPQTRLIVVSGGGFDTHANQLADQRELLGDLATGLAAFQAAVDAAGAAGRVRLAVVSEFGRRVAENASGGTDHGAGGLALVVGDDVHGGVHGGIEWDGLLDGDVPPTTNAAALFTALLEWWGADPVAVLGVADRSLALSKASSAR